MPGKTENHLKIWKPTVSCAQCQKRQQQEVSKRKWEMTSGMGHSTIWQEKVKDKGLDCSLLSQPWDMPPAIQLQQMIICVNFLRKQRSGHIGPLHSAAFTMSFLGSPKRRGLTSFRKDSLATCDPILSKLLYGLVLHGHLSMECQLSLLPWRLLNL